MSPEKQNRQNGMKQHWKKFSLDFFIDYNNFNGVLFVYQLTAHLITDSNKQLRNISKYTIYKQLNVKINPSQIFRRKLIIK